MNGTGELVDGAHEAVDALSVDLRLGLLQLEPPLVEADQVPVPSLFSLVARLERLRYYGGAPRDGGPNVARLVTILARRRAAISASPPPFGRRVRMLARFGFCAISKGRKLWSIRV